MNDEWKTGLYACTQYGTGECADIAFCCFCELSRQLDATVGFENSYNLPVLAVSPVVFPCLYYLIRRRVVKKYHFDEEEVLSFCTVLFCGLCSTCQVHRELELRNVPCGLTMKCLHRDAGVYIAMR